MDRYKSIEILHKITKCLIKELSLKSLLPLIAKELKQVVHFDRISIAIYHEQTNFFELHAITTENVPRLVFKGSFPRNGSRANMCLTKQKNIYFPDLRGKTEFLETDYLIEEGYLSGLSLPLMRGPHCYGTLNFNVKKINPFNSENLSFLQSVSESISIAVINVLAFKELEENRKKLMLQNQYLLKESKGGDIPAKFIGKSRAFREVIAQIESVAPTDTTVLLTGETGTGKELAAELVHEKSPRSNKPIVKVNTAALPDALMESELFGYERGAFTGAINRKVGRFEVADGGTLFLDEISEISCGLQSKLLRALQDQKITRLGSNTSKPVDCRIIVATNRNLEDEVKNGKFRKDLFFRLNVFPIELPPLRVRIDDLPMLAKYFVKQCSLKLGKEFRDITKTSIDLMSPYSWPGNVRELKNVIERACILTPNGQPVTISPKMLAFQSMETETELKPLEQVEREHIIRALRFTGGKIHGKGGTSELLGVHSSTLRGRLRKLGISIEKSPQQKMKNR